MPVRIRLLAMLMLCVLAFAACETAPVVVVVTATSEQGDGPASVIDDGTEAQDVEGVPTATPAGAIVIDDGTEAQDVGDAPTPTVVATQIAGQADVLPTPGRGTPRPRVTATPNRRATATPARRVTPTPGLRATSTPRVRATATPRGRATATTVSKRPTATPPIRPIPTAIPIVITRTDDWVLYGAMTAGGGRSESSAARVTGALGTFAGFSASSNASIQGGPLAGLIAAQQ